MYTTCDYCNREFYNLNTNDNTCNDCFDIWMSEADLWDKPIEITPHTQEEKEAHMDKQ